MNAREIVIEQALAYNGIDGMASPADILSFLKDAGFALVELPKQTIIPTGWRDDCLGCWPSGLGELAFQDPVSAWPGGEGISLPGGEFMPADRARIFAAALLAAADFSERPAVAK